MNRGWTFVFIGALFEVFWVTGLKHSQDFLSWTATILAIGISFILLIKAVYTKLPVGTVYAVFAGLGTTGTVLVEILVFGESLRVLKIMLMLVLLTGVIGLKVVTHDPQQKGSAS